jgi:hypothetical protein
VHAQKPGKRLQRRQRLPWRAQYTKMKAEAVEPGIALLLYGLQIMHGDYRITTDQRPVTMDEIPRFFPAEEIDRVFLVQSVDEGKIVAQHPARYRIPPRIDDKNAKARRPGRPRLAWAGANRQLDDCTFSHCRLVLRHRSGRTRTPHSG